MCYAYTTVVQSTNYTTVVYLPIGIYSALNSTLKNIDHHQLFTDELFCVYMIFMARYFIISMMFSVHPHTSYIYSIRYIIAHLSQYDVVCRILKEKRYKKQTVEIIARCYKKKA